jgi:FKBP-type peptidyl-prolyl cis-trans isomerase FkpA
MQRTLVLLVAALAALTSPILAQSPAPAASPTPAAVEPPDPSTLYALGVSVAKGLAGFTLTPAEAEAVMKGISDGLADKAGTVDVEAAMPRIRALAHARQSVVVDKEKARGKEFREEAAKKPGAVALPSGLVYVESQAGTGEAPGAKDTVKVKYRGTLVDGTEFDSSAKRQEPASFGLDRVIGCWTEGLQKMKPGGKARLLCPPEIAYGDRGRPGIPAGATLVFDLELVEVVKAAAATPVPSPVAPSPAPRQ